jgi:hypothetical protein
MAIAPAHVEYAQYVRSYSLFTLLAAVHVWLLIRWSDTTERPRAGVAAALTLTTAALLYTHYLALLLIAAETVFALVVWRRARGRVLGWAGAVAVGGVLFLPGLPLLLHNVTFDRVRNAQRPEPRALVRVLPDLMGELSVGQRVLGFSNPTLRRATLGAAAVLLPSLLLVGVFRGWRRSPEVVVLLLAVMVVPLAIYLGAGRRLVAVRFFLPFMTAYVVLLGCGLASLSRVRAAVATLLLVGICGVPLWHYYTRFAWSYDHRTVAAAIAQRSRPGDVLLVVHPYEALYFRWYLAERLPIRGLVFTALEEQPGYVIKPPPIEFEPARRRVVAASSEYSRLWIVGQSPRSFSSDPHEQARLLAWMDEAYVRADDLATLTGDDPVIRLYEVRQAGALAQ